MFRWVFGRWVCMISCTYSQFKKALLFKSWFVFFFLSVEVMWIYIYINIYINKIIKNIKYTIVRASDSGGHPVDCKVRSGVAPRHQEIRTLCPASPRRGGWSCSWFVKDFMYYTDGGSPPPPPPSKFLPAARM